MYYPLIYIYKNIEVITIFIYLYEKKPFPWFRLFLRHSYLASSKSISTSYLDVLFDKTDVDFERVHTPIEPENDVFGTDLFGREFLRTTLVPDSSFLFNIARDFERVNILAYIY